MFGMEFRRIFNRKTVIMLLLLIALNVTVFLWMYKTGKYESQVSDETYSQHVESILKQGDTINTISIFNKGGQSEYAERNNQKTIDEYVSIGEIETVKINGNIIITVIKNRFTHLAICVFMVIFLFRVFQGEEYKSMQTMLYATRNGRKRLAIARWVLSCVSLMVFIILNYAVIFGCVYVIDGYKCSDLLAPIQSVVEFYDCVMKTSIIGYIFFYIATTFLFSFSILIVMWLCMYFSDNRILSMSLMISLMAVEYLMYQVIAEQSKIVFLKYINLFNLVMPGDFLYKYSNYELFNYPINKLTTEIVLSTALILALSTIIFAIAENKRPIKKSSRLENWFANVTNLVVGSFHGLIGNCKMFGLEIYKILIVNRGLVYLVVVAVISCMMLDTSQIKHMGIGALLENVYNTYGGPISEEFEEYYNEQIESLNAVDEQYELALEKYDNGIITEEEFDREQFVYEGYAGARSCVERLTEQYSYLNRLKSERNIEGYLLSDRGYRILFQSNHSGKDLLVAAVICLLFCNGYAYDKRMRVKELIYSTRDGRNKIHRIRILVMTLLCGIAFALVYGLEFYEIQCVCPMRWWSAPVQSLSFFEGCRVNISLGFLVFLFEVSRFVMMVTLGILVYVLSYNRSSKEALIIPLAGAAIYIKIKSVANPAITITMSAIIIVFTVLGWIYVVRNRKLESKIR